MSKFINNVEQKLTLVSKLEEFQELASSVYPRVPVPSVEDMKQQLMSFYSENM